MFKNVKRHFWNYVGVFITGVIGAWAAIAAKQFVHVLAFLWRVLLRILSFGVPVWILLLVAALAVGMLPLIRRFRETTQPKWITRYRRDYIDGVIWLWEWNETDDGKWVVESLEPLCQQCELTLEVKATSRFTHALYCENCKTIRSEFGAYMLLKKGIVNEIRRRVRTGQWKQSSNRIQNLDKDGATVSH